MKTEVRAALLICGALSLGCRGLLGLDDKEFEGNGGTAGASTSSSSSGGSGGGSTGGSAGTGGSGGAMADDPLDDDFNFDPAGNSVAALEQRGWRFTWRDAQMMGGEKYPPTFIPPSVAVDSGYATFGMDVPSSWADQKKGMLMYKEIQGDFLVIAHATFQEKSAGSVSTQAGAGIMARDVESANSLPVGDQRWVSVDRGWTGGQIKIHGSWIEPGKVAVATMASTDVVSSAGPIALCRQNGQFQIWSFDGDKWVPRTNLLEAGVPEILTTVQVGLFVYAADLQFGPGKGVLGLFDYIEQHELNGSCDPSKYPN